jgi:hypothetical protein
MNRRKEERFEEALQREAEGGAVQTELAPLMRTAQKVRALAEPVPPPPHQLAPGRQRLLAEAARLRAGTRGQKERVRMTGVMKLGTALITLILVSGLVFGAGQVMADSLPGEPLYSLKLAVEAARLAWTTGPEAQADLSLAHAEERMDEVEELLQQQRAVDSATAERVQQQLQAALESAAREQNRMAAENLERLALAIQQRQQTMEKLAGESPQEPVRQILRVMERVREEAHAGAGDPDGLRQRLRYGTPPVPTALPSHTPGQGEPQRTGQPGPQGPHATEAPGGGPGPGPQPTMEPGSGPGPGPQPTMEPGSGPGPGPQPTTEPGSGPGPGPQPTMEPGSGPGPGPQPTVEPGSGPGPGPQPTVEPSGDPGPGSQPADKPGGKG